MPHLRVFDRCILFLKKSVYSGLAEELSKIVCYFDRLIQYTPQESDELQLFHFIDAKNKSVVELLNDLKIDEHHRSYILLNGNLNYCLDIESLLCDLKNKLNRHSRIAIVTYHAYLRSFYSVITKLGLRKGPIPSVFLTHVDMLNFARVSGFEILRRKYWGFMPFCFIPGGKYIERFLSIIPFIRNFGLVEVFTLRAVPSVTENIPSLSIVIPARNERGNIESALQRLPKFQAPIEIIFVEGHSTDGTWEEIKRVAEKYSANFHSIKIYQQSDIGKNNAVRLGFSKATGDLLTILDADLTMPPEMLLRFYNAYVRGTADFINGSRLVYPMEGEAMRFLNLLGNVFFAKALSLVLDIVIGDSLCGTKLLARRDYLRFTEWRADFGDFDPFGDFELLFPAAILSLGIQDIPVAYRARTYGTTNIHRFRHGLVLLKMTMIGFFRIKLGFSSSCYDKRAS